jgi:RNA polymerase sigma-70 factor, ECF subfamily
MMWHSRKSKTMSDAELVQRVLAGDRNMYSALVERHQTLLYRHACGMGIDHDTALDLVQDAFVKAYTSLRECRDPEHFRAWVFRIARNICLDHLKNVRRSTIPLSALPDAENIPGTIDSEVELVNTLQKALEQLPDSLREAFLLKHDAGYTYDEIAEFTDASPSAVKMRVHRARETLQEFLLESGIHAA